MQTNPKHRGEKLQNINSNKTSVIQWKQSNQLSLPHQDKQIIYYNILNCLHKKIIKMYLIVFSVEHLQLSFLILTNKWKIILNDIEKYSERYLEFLVSGYTVITIFLGWPNRTW